ncbi:MAG: hypothetical protein WA853_15245 [Candidatus Acidiferrum sp.]
MRFLITVLVTMLSTLHVYARAQNDQARQARHSKYMENAEVRHLADSTISVTANDARPLAQAVTAVSEEFGWAIDFEDPPYYSKYDLVDDTDSRWRAAHPTANGVTVIAGDTFQTQFLKTPDTDTLLAEEERVLDSVVSDYNASANPGRFAVRNEGDGRFAIVGTSVKDENGQDQTISPILDTPISIQEETRDANTTIEVILNALTVKSGAKVVPFMVPRSALARSQVTVGGENIPARVLLQQTLSEAKMKEYWRLYYDHDVRMYGFSLLPLMKAHYDASGNRTTVLAR